MQLITLTEWKNGFLVVIPAERVCVLQEQTSDKSTLVVFEGGAVRVRESIGDVAKKLSGAKVSVLS